MKKAVLVTGCTRGLGRALCGVLSEKNYRVYAIGRTQSALTSLTREFPSVVPINADISCPMDRDKIVEKIARDNVQIFIVHNASIAQPVLLKNMPQAVLEKHINVNCLAPLLLTQKLLPFVVKNGRILNITSGAATMALPGLLPYCITKAAMQHALRCMNAEFQDEIHCANLRPGLLDTTMVENWLQSEKSALPHREYYQHVKSTGQLICPTLAAQFIAWVLLETTDNQFKSTDWNIYDETHHASWLPTTASKPKPPITS